MNSRALILGSGISSALLISSSVFSWSETTFPSQKPSPLAPQPGYKFFGYMGCPASKVEDIAKKQRLLFFTDSIGTAQSFALSRTSILQQLKNADHPVVLQLEIPEEMHIHSKDLWHDSRLSKETPFPVPVHVHAWPALPPQLQKECGLQIRVHHVVTCEMQQQGGSICRALHFFHNDLKKKSS